MWYKNAGTTFFRFVTNTRLTDRQTDGQTEFSSLDLVCIPFSAVKTVTGRAPCLTAAYDCGVRKHRLARRILAN